MGAEVKQVCRTCKKEFECWGKMIDCAECITKKVKAVTKEFGFKYPKKRERIERYRVCEWCFRDYGCNCEREMMIEWNENRRNK